MRFQLTIRHGGREPRELLAEDAQLLAFTGPPGKPEWLDAAQANALLDAQPDANVAHKQAVRAVERAVAGLDELAAELERITRERADALLASHQRVREGARATGSVAVQPQLPPDVLGTYVLLPAGED